MPKKRRSPTSSRTERRALAEETLAILQSGYYQTKGEGGNQCISIATSLHLSRERTVLYRPDEVRPTKLRMTYEATNFRLINCTSLQAFQQFMMQDKKCGTNNLTTPLCLNFASARNPGGGFLKGANAQEESLARSTTLYASLNDGAVKQYYAFHRNDAVGSKGLYSDHMVYSPHIVVIRNDCTGELLSEPHEIAVVSSPAVNMGRLSEPPIEEIRRVMINRMNKILGVAAIHEHNVLILGAWGCGVFGHDPKKIASWWVHCLQSSQWTGVFSDVIFAVWDQQVGTPTYNAFAESLSPFLPE